MKLFVITIFPEFFDSPLRVGVLGRAIESGLVGVETVNPRDFATDRHHRVDDYGFGGGSGMVMKPEPLAAAIRDVRARAPGVRVFALTPGGPRVTSEMACELAHSGAFALVCGRYDGIDQRVIDEFCDGEISVGDFVLSGGECAALSIIDAAARFVPGVVGKNENVETDSFSPGLKWPVYTRPEVFEGHSAPDILLGGDTAAIEAWRRDEALARTARYRPELVVSAGAHRIGVEFLGVGVLDAVMTVWPLAPRLVCAAIFIDGDRGAREQFREAWDASANAWTAADEKAADARWTKKFGRFERMRLGLADARSLGMQLSGILAEGMGAVIRVEGDAGRETFSRLIEILGERAR